MLHVAMSRVVPIEVELTKHEESKDQGKQGII